MSRKKFTLSIEADLIEAIKIQAVLENQDVSTITEDLYRTYLKRSEAASKRAKKRNQSAWNKLGGYGRGRR